MNQHIKELTTVIKKEAEITESLEALLKQKLQAFIKWNAADLETVVKEEETYLHQMSELEKQRITLVRRISPAPEGQKLSTILLENPSDELEKNLGRLKQASETVVKRNYQNQQLVQNSLAFVQHTVSVLTNNYKRQLLDQKV